MTPQELHAQVVELMRKHSLPPTFKGSYSHADAVDRLWYLAARTYNEDCDARRAERQAAR